MVQKRRGIGKQGLEGLEGAFDAVKGLEVEGLKLLASWFGFPGFPAVHTDRRSAGAGSEIFTQGLRKERTC